MRRVPDKGKRIWIDAGGGALSVRLDRTDKGYKRQVFTTSPSKNPPPGRVATMVAMAVNCHRGIQWCAPAPKPGVSARLGANSCQALSWSSDHLSSQSS